METLFIAKTKVTVVDKVERDGYPPLISYGNAFEKIHLVEAIDETHAMEKLISFYKAKPKWELRNVDIEQIIK